MCIVTTKMEENASATLARRKKERDDYLNALSDRTRTLCLGTVVLLWGILTQKDSDHGLAVTRPWKIALLVIGFSAIVVLVLDFGEYACAYEHRRRLGGEGEEVSEKYGNWEVRMRFSKIYLGAITLVALCLVLFAILTTTLFAQVTVNAYPFLGKWCGGKDDKFTCLSIKRPTYKLEMQLSFKDMPTIDCDEIKEESSGILVADCYEKNPPLDDVKLHIRVAPGNDNTSLSVRFVWVAPPVFEDTRTLVYQEN